ncbi:hypothetical protein QJQ45_006471 [Haematococcus lacustris]|nr:hypothetical protein QJQ45_006471 [Haematococcus lacustris]
MLASLPLLVALVSSVWGPRLLVARPMALEELGTVKRSAPPEAQVLRARMLLVQSPEALAALRLMCEYGDFAGHHAQPARRDLKSSLHLSMPGPGSTPVSDSPASRVAGSSEKRAGAAAGMPAMGALPQRPDLGLHMCIHALLGPRHQRLPRCDHIFTHAVKGVAGLFSDQHVAALHACVPGGILLDETDGKVSGGKESRQASTRKQQLAKQALKPDRQSSQQAPQHLGRSRRRGGSGAIGAGATGHTQQAPPAHSLDNFLTSSSASRRLHAAPPSPSPTPSPAPPAPTTLLPRRNADGEVLLSIDGGPGSIAPERRAGLLWNLAAAAVSHLSQAWTRPVATVEPGTNLTGTAGPTGAGGLANGSVLPAAGRGAGARELGSKQPGGAVLVQEFGMVDAAPMVSGSQQAAPRPPDTASTIPSAPASLPTVAPGPDQPQSRDALTAMQPIVTRPVLKVQQLPPALWNLDRVDQVAPPLDHQYSYGAPGEVGIGQGVTIFGLDSGVIREHQEFQSWNGGASRASYGFDFVDNDPDAHDCDGHGTHVGATALGRSVGVAKGASLVAVRVLDCTGSGSISDTVAGIDWVAAHARGPSVAIMSLGVAGGSWSATLESATRTLINTYNITVVVASGNSAIDACTVVPASLPESITVAASSMDNKFDPVRPAGTETMYRWSNTGSCVDIFAPGVEIWSACGGISEYPLLLLLLPLLLLLLLVSDAGISSFCRNCSLLVFKLQTRLATCITHSVTLPACVLTPGRCPQVTPDAYTWASGTSMAVPHVAGLAAMYLGEYPKSTPAQVAAFIKDSSSPNRINDSRMLPGTPNRMIYTRGSALLALTTQPLVQAAAGNTSTSVP